MPRGATHSTILLVTADGTIVARSEGLATNHWLIGIDECLRRLHQLVVDVKKAAGLPADLQLESLVREREPHSEGH